MAPAWAQAEFPGASWGGSPRQALWLSYPAKLILVLGSGLLCGLILDLLFNEKPIQETWCAAVHGVAKSQTQLNKSNMKPSNWANINMGISWEGNIAAYQTQLSKPLSPFLSRWINADTCYSNRFIGITE